MNNLANRYWNRSIKNKYIVLEIIGVILSFICAVVVPIFLSKYTGFTATGAHPSFLGFIAFCLIPASVIGFLFLAVYLIQVLVTRK